MLRGKRVIVRPVRADDLPTLGAWSTDPEMIVGPFQRFQLEHGRLLANTYAQTGLITRENGFLLVELVGEQKAIGYVRYSTGPFPDPDVPAIDIGYGIAEPQMRGKGYATEALSLLLDYIFSGYPVGRVSAYTDAENAPSRRLLERLGFACEGTMRSVYFRSGGWHDMCIYGILRREWAARSTQERT
jgi:RimJ/RimL family protein N-acetyltransferase